MLYLENDIAYINNEEVDLSVAPFITESRTLVPLRFIGEAFGAYVDYEAGEITITREKN